MDNIKVFWVEIITKIPGHLKGKSYQIQSGDNLDNSICYLILPTTEV